MQVPRIIQSSKTFTPKFSEVHSKEIPLFHYNTTIVDLKPFNPENYEETENNYLYDYNDLYTDLHLNTEFQNNKDNGLLNNPVINSQKRYLIKRNLNFYEPVKDAEMLAQLKSLRSKLNITNLKAGNLKYSKSLTLPEKNKFALLNNFSKNSIPSLNDSTSKPTPLVGSTVRSSTTYMDEDITSAKIDDYLHSNGRMKTHNSLKDVSKVTEDYSMINNQNNMLNVQMRPPIEVPTNIKIPKEKTIISNDARTNNAANNYSDRDNYSLKSYNLSSFVTDKKGIKSPECNLDYYVNQGSYENLCQCNGEHENHHVITIPQKVPDYERSSLLDYEDMTEINKITQSLNVKKSAQIISANKLRRSRTQQGTRAHTSFNDNKDTNRIILSGFNNKEGFQLKTSLSKVPQNLPDISQQISMSAYQKNRNVKNILRKSTKSRLGNIYKEVEKNRNLLETYRNQPCSSPKSEYYSNDLYNQQCCQKSCQSAVTRKSDHYRSEIDTQDGIELSKYNPTRINRKKSNLTPDSTKCSVYKTMMITDTSNALAKNPNLFNKKGYPYERNKRKEAPGPTVQNIISDIPSTLNRMSLIGNVTNVEKLIANRLSEYYTTNRIIN